MNRENVILEKSMAFAVRAVRMYKYLREEKTEDILSKQLLRSATSVGANVREAQQGQSRKDFLAKMSIALKESSETEYWLELLYHGRYITEAEHKSMKCDCVELIKLLTAIVKGTR